MTRRKSFVVYTAIANDYDHLKRIPASLAGIDFVCFTNRLPEGRTKYGWTMRALYSTEGDWVRACRNVKIKPHVHLPEYDTSLWVDGNVILNDKTGLEIIRFLLSGAQLSVFPHPERHCIYDEAEQCVRIGKDGEDIINRHVSQLALEGYPRHAGLADTGVIFRHHNDPMVAAAMDLWAHWIAEYSRRDQLSFDYVMWKRRLDLAYIPGSRFKGGGAFVRGMHRSSMVKSLVSFLESNQVSFPPFKALVNVSYQSNCLLKAIQDKVSRHFGL